MGRSIEEIDSEIVKLFKERAEELSKMDRTFSEVYTVFNNETGMIDDNTFVLNPLKGRDLVCLDFYVDKLRDGVFKVNMVQWLSYYKDKKCVRDRTCPITNIPVCCAHCPELSNCLDLGREVCPYVEIGDVASIEDCEVEG